jgi:hypothetical protein
MIPGGSNMAVSAKVATRISTQLKKYQTVLKAAEQRDISEADIVTIIADMLADVFGYDKYKEVISEHSIRGTSVDLAVTVGEKKRFLIEAKAINIELKDQHVKQAVRGQRRDILGSAVQCRHMAPIACDPASLSIKHLFSNSMC